MADVQEAARRHEIGVHSYSHESMAYEDDAFFERDLEGCFRFFADELRLPLRIYAFPNGSYRPSHLEILERSGIQYVLLVDEKIAGRRNGVLPRISLNYEHPAQMRLDALGQSARGVM